MDQLGDYLSVLETLHRKVNSGQLARCVLRQAVESRTPPEFLYASGSPGRYNSKGTECIYWAEDEKTARAEYRKYELGSATYETFFCKYRLGVLDLGNIKVLSALGLTESDLYADWRMRASLQRRRFSA
jgi:RES domain-containing protein